MFPIFSPFSMFIEFYLGREHGWPAKDYIFQTFLHWGMAIWLNIGQREKARKWRWDTSVCHLWTLSLQWLDMCSHIPFHFLVSENRWLGGWCYMVRVVELLPQVWIRLNAGVSLYSWVCLWTSTKVSLINGAGFLPGG